MRVIVEITEVACAAIRGSLSWVLEREVSPAHRHYETYTLSKHHGDFNCFAGVDCSSNFGLSPDI